MKFANILALIAVTTTGVQAEDEVDLTIDESVPAVDPVNWEANKYDEEEYFKNIPDIVNMT